MLLDQYFDIKAKVKVITQARNQLKEQEDKVRLLQSLVAQATNTLAQISPELLQSADQDAREGFFFDYLSRGEDGKKVWPDIIIVLALGGLCGMMGGVVLGYLVDIADKTYRSPDEITNQLNIPLIGHIPVITANKRNLIENSYVHPLVCTYHRPQVSVFRSISCRADRVVLQYSREHPLGHSDHKPNAWGR